MKRLLLVGLFAVLPMLLFVSCSPWVGERKAVSAEQTALARTKVKEILNEFTAPGRFIEIKLAQTDIDAIMAVASHTVPKAEFLANISEMGSMVSATVTISAHLNLFVNARCLLMIQHDRYGFEDCTIGHLTVPGKVAEWGVRTVAWLLFDASVAETAGELIADSQFQDGQLVLSSRKSEDFKARVKDKLPGLVSTVRAVTQNRSLNQDVLRYYLQYLGENSRPDDSLEQSMKFIFIEAQRRSRSSSAVDENTAAIWALAIFFGNSEFHRLAGTWDLREFAPHLPAQLRGRRDLALHFLYSMLLDQVGRSDFGLGVGEVKELLDSNTGSSGFSFADLAADKAGLMFSEYATRNESAARKVQAVMSQLNSESVFFPSIHDLPEGISKESFELIYGDVSTSEYRRMEDQIDQRIAALKLYREEGAEPLALDPAVPVVEEGGSWLTVDTHIHSNHSDGGHSIAEIAGKAKEFGCDAIAITDHGDYNFDTLFADAYFKEIREAAGTSGLSIIPGMEWNIAPFNGREHVTVLMPDSAQLPRKLATFRNRFDHYKQQDSERLDVALAHEWLNNSVLSGETTPVLTYNHPSRKVRQTGENLVNFLNWRARNPFMVGFEGAPGHQRREKGENGSYVLHQKTIHRWDPSIATPGGEWDQLLRMGKNVWGALAPSDFHNLKMDYWPCEFSTTHLYAKSTSHNDVLDALKSGNFWAQHGKFVDAIDFRVRDRISGNMATLGGTLTSTADSVIEVSLMLILAPWGWQGAITSLDTLELILNTPEETRVVTIDTDTISPDGFFSYSALVPTEAQLLSVRLRGSIAAANNSSMYFYTNPIRVVTNRDLSGPE